MPSLIKLLGLKQDKFTDRVDACVFYSIVSTALSNLTDQQKTILESYQSLFDEMQRRRQLNSEPHSQFISATKTKLVTFVVDGMIAMDETNQRVHKKIITLKGSLFKAKIHVRCVGTAPNIRPEYTFKFTRYEPPFPPNWLSAVPEVLQKTYKNLIPFLYNDDPYQPEGQFFSMAVTSDYVLEVHEIGLQLLGIAPNINGNTLIESPATPEQISSLKSFAPIFRHLCDANDYFDGDVPPLVDFLGLMKRSTAEMQQRKIEYGKFIFKQEEKLHTVLVKKTKETYSYVLVPYITDDLFKRIKNLPPQTQKEYNLLGVGAFTAVFRSYDFTNGQEVALKRPTLNEFSQSHRYNEFIILNAIYQYTTDTQLPGLVGLPRIQSMNNTDIQSIENKFIASLDDYIIPLIDENNIPTQNALQKKYGKYFSLENITNAFIQLAEGLVILRKLGFFHGDIKSENIYFEIVGGKLHFDLGDFGGSAEQNQLQRKIQGYINVKKHLKEQSKVGTISSPLNLNQADRKLLVEYINNYNFEQWSKLQYAREVAAFGLVMLEFLSKIQFKTGDPLFPEDPHSHDFAYSLSLAAATPQLIEKRLNDQGASNMIYHKLLVKVLQNDWTKRPLIEEVLNDLKNIAQQLEKPTEAVASSSSAE